MKICLDPSQDQMKSNHLESLTVYYGHKSVSDRKANPRKFGHKVKEAYIMAKNEDTKVTDFKKMYY